MAPEKNDDASMPMWEHLDELRNRLFKVIISLVIATLICFQYADILVTFLKAPLLKVLPEGDKYLHYVGVADKFVFYVKVSILGALALTSPIILYQLWQFVVPALYKKERKLAFPFVFFGTLSFIAGLAFCYYILLPYTFEFLINFGGGDDKAIITLDSYFSLTIKFLLGVGALFEFPMVIISLALLGIVEADTLSKFRGHAIIVILVLAAVITPPDVISQIICSIPLYILYEICIVSVRIITKRRRAREAAEEKAEREAEERELRANAHKHQEVKISDDHLGGIVRDPNKPTS